MKFPNDQWDDAACKQLRPIDQDRFVSLTQERWWYLDQMWSNRGQFYVATAWRFIGELDAESLDRAVAVLVERHDILRTDFQLENGRLVCSLREAGIFRLQYIDLSGVATDQQWQALQKNLMDRVHTDVSGAEGPSFGMTLYRLSDVSYVLFLIGHRTILDEWSADLLLLELVEAYEKGRHSRKGRSAPARVQYADWAFSRERRLRAGKFSDAISYWKEVLEPPLPILRIVPNRPRPEQFTGLGKRRCFEIPAEIMARMKPVCRATGTTLEILFLSTYLVALRRYANQEDIIVGLEDSGRSEPGMRGVIGPLRNVIPIRIKFIEGLTVRGLIQLVAKFITSAREQSTVPFELLVKSIDVSRDTSRTPICQALFRAVDMRSRQLRMGEVTVEDMDWFPGVCQADLRLKCDRSDAAMYCSLEYSSDVFSDGLIERFVALLLRLTQSIGEILNKEVDGLSVLSHEEIESRRAANATECYWEFSSITEMFERFLSLDNKSTAVIAAHERVDYAALSGLVYAIQDAIRVHDLGRGCVIGILTERAPRMLASILAILRSGAAYLPLDPGHPEARNRYICTDSCAALVLTDDMYHNVATRLGPKTLNVQRLSKSQNVVAAAKSLQADPAYVIYTSGSTGQPKGVVIPHRALSNFVQSMILKFDLNERDRVLAITTIAFDIHVLEMLVPLAIGAVVVLPNSHVAFTGRALSEIIREQCVSVMQATPSTWQLLSDVDWRGKNDLKAIVGGEAVSQRLLDWLGSRVAHLWNVYGPTETTVWSTCAKLDVGQYPAIGFPIHNTTVHVANSRRSLTPSGTVGELYIGGDGLALGYMSDGATKDEKFTEADFDTGEQPFFRTGDMVVQHPDGSLEFVGRCDSQVKIRGHRIELREIECAIERIDGVGRAVAVVHEASGDDRRLVAYFEVSPCRPVGPTDIRKELRYILPHYMVPQHLIPLEKIPTTLRGKIDLGALPKPDNWGPEGELAEPATDNERLLSDVWRRLLGQQVINRHDNFFDIGGHSLLAIRLAAEVRERFGIEMSLRDIVLEDLSALARKLTEVPS